MKLWVSKGQYGFSTRLKSGNVNGNEADAVSMFMEIQFRKEKEPEGNCQIDIKDGFLSCYNSKEGVKPKFVVMDYTILQGHNPDANKEPKVEEKTSFTAQELADEAMADFGDIIEIDESEIAF